MHLRARRSWLAVCTVLVLGLGLVAQGWAAADMDARMMSAAAAGEMSPASGDCDGCGGGDDGLSASECFALCGGAVAVLPSVAPLDIVAMEQPAPVAVHADPGRNGPPDPYPPRPFVLS